MRKTREERQMEAEYATQEAKQKLEGVKNQMIDMRTKIANAVANARINGDTQTERKMLGQLVAINKKIGVINDAIINYEMLSIQSLTTEYMAQALEAMGVLSNINMKGMSMRKMRRLNNDLTRCMRDAQLQERMMERGFDFANPASTTPVTEADLASVMPFVEAATSKLTGGAPADAFPQGVGTAMPGGTNTVM